MENYKHQEYEYPDKNDELTCRLIDGEYDGRYWAESEDAVIDEAIAQISRISVPVDMRKMLDAGCGIGRLFSRFSSSVERITGIEPDRERFAEAKAEADRINARNSYDGNDKKIIAVHGDIHTIPENEKFDVILSSHVLQHIPQKLCEELMRDMTERLSDGGLLMITTTLTDGEADRFYRESWKDGERFSEEIGADDFETVFDSSGALPVRIFSARTIERLAAENGLEIISRGAYHYADHHSVEEDKAANARGDARGARDSFWILRKPFYIDGNICYQFSFSIMDDELGLKANDEPELRRAVRKAYPTAIFDDDETAVNEPFFRDMKTAKGFLHGGGLPFENFRVMLKDYQLKFPNFETTDSAVVMSIFPESDTVQISVFVSVKNMSPDGMIYLRHVQGNGAKLLNADGREISVREIFDEVSKCLGRSVTDVGETYLVEITRFGNGKNVNEILRKHICLIYGMMCGDEGWRNVPISLAEERLTDQWGSRDFVKFVAFGDNFFFINMNHSETAERYTANREHFDHCYYGDIDPYFLIDSNYAGVNHGLLFSLELVLVIKTICSRILRRQAGYYVSQTNHLSKDIRKTKMYRGQLLTTLNKIESLTISEMGELERIIIHSQQIDPIIDKIKYLLELLESELNLLYQDSTNKLVNILTVAGLILAALQIILGA